MNEIEQALSQHRARINIALSQFTVPLFSRTYRFFAGDFVSVIVLGEIAHRNVALWLANEANREGDLAHHEVRSEAFRPCNALSIAEACGIPRETVRRKVNELIKRGWIVKDSKGHLYLRPGMSSDFDELTAETVRSLLATADSVRQLIAEPPNP